MTNAERLNQAASTLGFDNAAAAIQAGFDAPTLLGMLEGADAPAKPSKVSDTWKSDTVDALRKFTKGNRTFQNFQGDPVLTDASKPTAGHVVGRDHRDPSIVRAIPYSTESGELRAGKHIVGTVATLQAVLDAAATLDDSTSTKSTAPRSRPAKFRNTPTGADLAKRYTLTELRQIAKSTGTKFGKAVDGRKLSDVADALASVWTSDHDDAAANMTGGADA